jgi:hypothetical protein
MRRRALGVLLVTALAVSIGACEEYPTRPVNRRPIISSVDAFPTVLGLGDSTLVTVFATDPDGDTLVYDWEAHNGLAIKDDPYDDGVLYNTSSRSRVFYLRWRPANYDTAFVWCGVRDRKGGGDGRRVLILLRD